MNSFIFPSFIILSFSVPNDSVIINGLALGSIVIIIWATTWQNQQNEYAPSEDSDQSGHPPSLIRVFAVRSMDSLGPRFLHAGSENSDQTWRMSRLIWVFAGRTVMLLVLSCSGSIIIWLNALVWSKIAVFTSTRSYDLNYAWRTLVGTRDASWRFPLTETVIISKRLLNA